MTLLIVVGIAILLFVIFRKCKLPKIGSLACFTGGVKAGKSAVSLHFAVRTYKRVRFSWRIKCFFCKLFRKQKPEEPLFYSNIPLRKIKYVPLTREHLLRKVRLNWGSVVFLDEVSLVADSQLIRNGQINFQLLLFAKLFGHSCGGLLIFNSQQITDLHYAFKRCTSQYFYVHHTTKLPFLRLSYLREERYSEDGTTVNNYDGDVESTLKRIVYFSSIYKKYDAYCYSVLTDDLPTKNEIKYNGKHDSLKTTNIVSFRKEYTDLFVSGKSEIDKALSEVFKNA